MEMKKTCFIQSTSAYVGESKVEDMLSTKDPTLVIYEKPSLEPSAREAVSTSTVTPEGKGVESPDETSMFSFGARVEKNNFQKVIFLCFH